MDTAAPESEDALAEAVADAMAARRPLAVRGQGSKAGWGGPVAAAASLTTERLAGITYYEPGELVMEAMAGTPLAEIEATLAEHGQRLAFEPPDLAPLYGGRSGAGTIGGTFACNLSGPRRPFAGAARDHLLGVRAVSGRGERFASGGRVVKNVTGYDMAKLMAGSFGTLAVLARVTFKVLPAPEDARTLLLAGRTTEDGLEALGRALDGPFEPTGAAHLPATAAARSSVPAVACAGASVTAIRLEGARGAVDDRAERLREALAGSGAAELLDADGTAALWREIGAAALLPDDGEGTLWRLSLPPAFAPYALRHVAASVDAEALVDWAGGLVWLAVPPDGVAGGVAAVAAAVRAAIADCGGHATLMRGPEATRAEVPVFQPEAPALAALSARLKANFDPHGVLNPGRMRPEAA